MWKMQISLQQFRYEHWRAILREYKYTQLSNITKRGNPCFLDCQSMYLDHRPTAYTHRNAYELHRIFTRRVCVHMCARAFARPLAEILLKIRQDDLIDDTVMHQRDIVWPACSLRQCSQLYSMTCMPAAVTPVSQK